MSSRGSSNTHTHTVALRIQSKKTLYDIPGNAHRGCKRVSVYVCGGGGGDEEEPIGILGSVIKAIILCDLMFF